MSEAFRWHLYDRCHTNTFLILEIIFHKWNIYTSIDLGTLLQMLSLPNIPSRRHIISLFNTHYCSLSYNLETEAGLITDQARKK